MAKKFKAVSSLPNLPAAKMYLETKILCVFLILISTTNGFTMECDFTNSYNPFTGKVRYFCHVKAATLDGTSAVTEISGTHVQGQSNSDVESLYVDTDRVPSLKVFNTIPSDVEKFLTNLTSFAWVNGNLTNITADDLKPFPNLGTLWLVKNNIEKLDGDLFKYSPKLFWINFSTNRIKLIGRGLLDDLKVTDVDFFNNKCISLYAFMPGLIERLRERINEENACYEAEANNLTVS